MDNISYVGQFGKIYLYRYNSNLVPTFFVPTFYIHTSNTSPEDIIFYWNNAVNLTEFAIGETPPSKLQLYDKNIYHVGNAQIINYTKTNPTLWRVKVSAKKAFILSFVEAYDPLWEARVYKNGERVEVVKPVPLYGVINGFWINQTGIIKIVIRYTPQVWFEYGLAVSATTLFGCIMCSVYEWMSDKHQSWIVKLKRLLTMFYKKSCQ